MHSVEDVVEHIHRKFKAIDLEEGSSYADTYNPSWILALVTESLTRVGETQPVVSEENRQRLLASFGVIHRRSAQAVRYVSIPEDLKDIWTSQRPRDSVGVGALRRGEVTVFLDEYSSRLGSEDLAVVERVIEDDTLPRSAVEIVPNRFLFKSPLNLVLADHKPERLFVKGLVKQENCAGLVGWVKSTDQGFYPIEYSWRRGAQFKRGSFNPDFFLATPTRRISIEIKDDAELQNPSAENRGKFKAAKEHFRLVSERVANLDYEFHFLAPQDYDAFFQFLREGRPGYVSALDAALGVETDTS
jgi:type III restriction enzyme